MTQSQWTVNELREHIKAITRTMAISPISEIVELLVTCFSGGHKLLICGNGGSAADAQHLAAEFVGGFRNKYPPLPAVALTTDSSILTSIGNDMSFDDIFSHQVGALGKSGDVLFAISTSGNSVNVLNALNTARKFGLITTGFLSERGIPLMGAACDVFLAVPSENTARIQECHEFAMHVICEQVEERLLHG